MIIKVNKDQSDHFGLFVEPMYEDVLRYLNDEIKHSIRESRNENGPFLGREDVPAIFEC